MISVARVRYRHWSFRTLWLFEFESDFGAHEARMWKGCGPGHAWTDWLESIMDSQDHILTSRFARLDFALEVKTSTDVMTGNQYRGETLKLSVMTWPRSLWHKALLCSAHVKYCTLLLKDTLLKNDLCITFLFSCYSGSQRLIERVAFEGQTVVFRVSQAPKGSPNFFYKDDKKIRESCGLQLKVLRNVTASATAKYYCNQGPRTPSSIACHLHIVCKFTVNRQFLPRLSPNSSLEKIFQYAYWGKASIVFIILAVCLAASFFLRTNGWYSSNDAHPG